jgi:hypothetical protein
MAIESRSPTLPAMADPERKICALHRTLGAVQACPGAACPFWEQGGAVLPSGCELERLAVDVERPDLAEYLLEIREQLESARNREERNAARRAFAGLIPPDFSGR